mmetsp:Transcript_23901/g.37229  ORF Transcript_23901/g.37229 Transcript_23901/m.37229 type:complete len:125 (+) Transcript_23901:58-432(+)
MAAEKDELFDCDFDDPQDRREEKEEKQEKKAQKIKSFQVASDIHLEFLDHYAGDRCQKIPRPLMAKKAPVLCLVGDIGNPLGIKTHQDSYENYLLEQADKYEHVMVLFSLSLLFHFLSYFSNKG